MHKFKFSFNTQTHLLIDFLDQIKGKINTANMIYSEKDLLVFTNDDNKFEIMITNSGHVLIEADWNESEDIKEFIQTVLNEYLYLRTMSEYFQYPYQFSFNTKTDNIMKEKMSQTDIQYSIMEFEDRNSFQICLKAYL